VQAKRSRGPVVWPLLIAIIGVILLLDNFLLLGSFNVTALWPLLLVVAGAVILLRGDFVLDDSERTFGITRGSVESALLEVNAGDIDVRVTDTTREGRLISGTYAADARPDLTVDEIYAHLRLDRAVTPWLSFNRWTLGLARGLPWQLLISSSVGALDLDLSEVIVEGGVLATGIGDVRVTTPAETLSPLNIQSTMGNIVLLTPLGVKSRVRVSGPRTFGIHMDRRRYTLVEPGLYVSLDTDPEAPLIDIRIRGTFGDAYLT
jgi:hypothetical protein